MFKKVDNNVNLVKLEEGILRYWRNNNIFEKSLKKTRNGKKFIFYEGPPTANGEPGVHHVLSRVFKDIFPRYKTMKGFFVNRKAGWDTHGLPVEIEIEKKLGINSKKEIEKIVIEKFNRLCRESVMKYEAEWKKMTERIGFWIDMDNAYFTFKNEYIETIWWILKTLWGKDLLYEGYKIVPYCPRCGTALSSHEVALGYKDVEDYSIIVRFPHAEMNDTFFLVWTTTPWTLVSNVACAVSPEATYVIVLSDDKKYILAEDLLGSVFTDIENCKVLKKIKGRMLIDSKYCPVYKNTDSEGTFRIISGDFVSTEEGTGIVHIAPAFGEDDMRVGRANKLPVVQMVDEEGKFKPEVEAFGSLSIEEANPMIIEDLKRRGLLFKVWKFEHSYPFCWRCEKKLMYYAKKSWYIKTSQIKQQLIDSNEKVNWYPDHIKYGRFGNWLENNVDWALTRERYWGTPLPIWVCKNGHMHCIGSIKELQEKNENVPADIDLHKPYVDRIKIKCDKCGEKMVRTPEVIDVWFDSGSMPFAQYHYPFENKEIFIQNYPADFICEAIDQTRGWFYTMLTISTLLFGRSSYKNVLCLGLINDEFGQKMSKSKGNVVRPWDVLNKQGADALRWYFFTVVSPWNAKNFSIKAIDEVIRKFLLTLWNTYSFFVIYANIDNFYPEDYKLDVKERTEIDRWIISELNKTIDKVTSLLDDFNVTDSGRLIESFVDDLSNWYVRRSRRRFWKSENDNEKISAYLTLFECLLTVSKLAAPFIPFISEEIYQNLINGIKSRCESVHLENYPAADKSLIDEDLSFKMNVIRKIIGLGRSVRSKINIKTRQPLKSIKIYFDSDPRKKEACIYFQNIILEELNIKKMELIDKLEHIVLYNIKPNLKSLGPKYGAMLPEIKNALQSENPVQVALKVKNNKNVNINIGGSQLELLPEEIIVEISSLENISAESDGEYTVGISVEITKELQDEGFCRELVHQIQNMRKEADFKIENTIFTSIECSENSWKIIEKYSDYIMRETLTEHLGKGLTDDMFKKEIRVNGQKIKAGIRVAGSIV
ncbi:MAG: Isoleucine--tRNA ligase [Actinobacteria bacterium ADurb.Bin346]|nr:MAG: Isoleucine--tRNA ligase [Actinobacteria bacterium ADurb.Bin346]